MPSPKTIVVGLGNPMLGDDGVGCLVAEQLMQQPGLAGVEIESLAVGGLTLMEHMVGFERAIVVDSINLGDAPLGSVHSFALEELPNPFGGHLGSSHETNLQTALQIGRELGAALPAEVRVVAIASPYVYDFSDQLTPPVEAAVPQAVAAVLQLLGNWH